MEPDTIASIGAASGLLGKLLGDLPLSRVQEQRILLAREQVVALEKKVVELERENAELKRQNQNATKQLAGAAIAEQFVQKRGALFKRQPGGGYEDTPYCPVCKIVMGYHMGEIPFICSRCQHTSAFEARELEAVLMSIR